MEGRNAEAELVGLIYTAALEKTLWPTLIDGLAGFVAQVDESVRQLQYDYAAAHNTTPPAAHVPLHYSLSDSEVSLLQRLSPHIKKAFSLALKHHQSDLQHDAFRSLIDRLPMGVVIVDHEHRVVIANEKIDALIELDCGISTVDDKLRINDYDLNAVFADLSLSCSPNANLDHLALSALQFGESDLPAPLTALVVPICEASPHKMGRHLFSIFVAMPWSSYELADEALEKLFGLTKAECRVVKALVRGHTIDEIGQKYATSPATVRTQLRAIFRKTGVSRQTQLVELLLTSPALWSQRQKIRPTPLVRTNQQQKDVDIEPKMLTLPDGRSLAFAEYGESAGVTTLLFHSLWGSRFQRFPDDKVAEQHGVRLIIPERPGYGFSTPHPQRSLSDWVNDVVYLTDHLGIARFNVVGYCMGGIYALALAALAPQRLDKVLVLNTAAPDATLNEIRDMALTDQFFFGLARYLPHVMMQFAELRYRGMAHDPDRFFDRLYPGEPECDRQVLRDPKLRRNIQSSLLAGAARTSNGFGTDVVLCTQPWGFNLEDIDFPVALWHGAQDRHVPAQLGQRVAKTLHRCEARFFQHEGVFLLYTQWHAIMKWAAAHDPDSKAADAMRNKAQPA